MYSKTTLNRSTTGPNLTGPFREVVGSGIGGEVGQGVKISLSVIVWEPNKAIDIGKWSIFGGGRLERFYCIYI